MQAFLGWARTVSKSGRLGDRPARRLNRVTQRQTNVVLVARVWASGHCAFCEDEDLPSGGLVRIVNECTISEMTNLSPPRIGGPHPRGCVSTSISSGDGRSPIDQNGQQLQRRLHRSAPIASPARRSVRMPAIIYRGAQRAHDGGLKPRSAIH